MHISIFYDDLKSSKLGQVDLVLLCDQGSLVSLCMQRHKSLCTAVMICATLVNMQTYMQHVPSLCDISSAQSAELKTSFAGSNLIKRPTKCTRR